LFQQALLATYNPFTGGDPNDPQRSDSTPNPESVTRGLLVDVFRINTTSLTMADLKVSRNDLFQLPAGPVGFGAGVEFRHETYEDDRDPRLDGSIAFVALDGSSNGSDVLGASPTPDSRGSRDVFSAYGELIVPIVSPAMDVPFIHSLDLQFAGRFESYTTFGDVAKPRIAASWRPVSWFQVRGAWSLGFRAPGLPQLFENGIQRSNTRTDWIRCEADLRAGRIANFDDCTRTQSVVSNRSGSQDLVPETSENFTVGLTLDPPLPDRLGNLTLTVDYWEIRQKNLIGIFGDSNALTLDYLLRVGGSSNPLVQRVAPTAQDIADFAGTGLTPVGRVIQVVDNYVNLTPRRVSGLDFGLYYSVRDTGIGNFSMRLNAARLIDFFQEPGPGQAALIAAQAAGDIDPTINIVGAADLVRENGRPKWRFSGSLTWRHDGFGIGWYTTYISSVVDTSATQADGTPFRVDDFLSHSVYVQYEVDDRGSLLNDFRLRLGVRNLTNELAPLADGTFGYLGELHSNRGRQFYISARKRF
jgi:outer membrane receptor protein involved in Fe transport